MKRLVIENGCKITKCMTEKMQLEYRMVDNFYLMSCNSTYVKFVLYNEHLTLLILYLSTYRWQKQNMKYIFGKVVPLM